MFAWQIETICATAAGMLAFVGYGNGAFGNSFFLRNHGVIVGGPTVAQAYDDLYYLERAAMVQVLAMQTGASLQNIDQDLAERTARQIADDTQQAVLHFESLKRMLDRDEPGWRRLAA